MQKAVARMNLFSCFQFDGDLEALVSAVPNLDHFTCVNNSKTEIWVRWRRINKSDNTCDVCHKQLKPKDWIVVDSSNDNGYIILNEHEFSKKFEIDPDPIYEYTDDLAVWHDDYNWVVAKDEAEASNILAETCGYGAEDLKETVWSKWLAGKRLTIEDECLGPCTMMCCAWAKHGAGFLGSTEY